MPKVWNVKDKDKPNDAIFCGRGSDFGNPFIIGRDGSRIEVIYKFENYALRNPGLLRRIEGLKGKDLLCFCAPKPCHCDVILRLANPPEEEF